MNSIQRLVCFFAFAVGGCLYPSLFLLENALADTLTLKNGKELKGLVVEKHADRLIFSTEKKEIPVLLSSIKNVAYDDPEQNFFQIGKAYEAENKLGEALAYYEKAREINPSFEEAKKAAIGVRNRFWAASTEGPRNEVETKQILYDSWGQGKSPDELIKGKTMEVAESLRQGLGIRLKKKGDWVEIAEVSAKKDAAVAGLKIHDRLVSIDGESLRYLGVEVVSKKMLEPRYSNFTLEFERDCFLKNLALRRTMEGLGLKLKLEYQGLVVKNVKSEGSAADAGLKEEDLLTHVQGAATRYLPLKKVLSLIQTSKTDKIVMTVRRSVSLTRR